MRDDNVRGTVENETNDRFKQQNNLGNMSCRFYWFQSGAGDDEDGVTGDYLPQNFFLSLTTILTHRDLV